jgi:hypothetical protein
MPCHYREEWWMKSHDVQAVPAPILLVLWPAFKLAARSQRSPVLADEVRLRWVTAVGTGAKNES